MYYFNIHFTKKMLQGNPTVTLVHGALKLVMKMLRCAEVGRVFKGVHRKTKHNDLSCTFHNPLQK